MAWLQSTSASENASKLGTGEVCVCKSPSAGDGEVQWSDRANKFDKAKSVQFRTKMGWYGIATTRLDLQYYLDFCAQTLVEHFNESKHAQPWIEKVAQIEDGRKAVFDF